MTKDELKRVYSMRDILDRYGLHPNRAGFIPCPFHKEKTASMKIYEDSYYCFGCGASGDIFTFIQEMDAVGFKEAFLSLGGSYEKPTFSSRLALYRAQKRQAMREKEAKRISAEKQLNMMLIDIYRDHIRKSQPLSEVWCDCWNALQLELYEHEQLNEPR